MNQIIEEKLKLLPPTPGVYIMYNDGGEVIYVGKAVSLKNRVRQYFQSGKGQLPKVAAMVSHIADFETILTSNETEAFTLESNLIKQYMPRYNILLKDDKHFPYVRINLKQDFPRVEVVRKVKKDGAKYLGPYLSGIALRDSLNVVREHFPVRHCKKDIAKAIARRERPCLMVQLGKCCAPCSGNVSREEYHGLLHAVSTFLEGHTDSVIAELTEEMQSASAALEFERAGILRDRIAAINALGEKQIAIAAKGTDQDVLALCAREGKTLVFALFVRGGKVVGTERFSLGGAEGSGGEDEALGAFLKQYYSQTDSIPPEILLYQPAADQEAIGAWLCARRGKAVNLHVPQRGEKRRLTELAHHNGMDQLEKAAVLQKRAWERGEGALSALSVALGLDALPSRMECFDNSHIQGRDTVSSMVVFIDGQPAPKLYRRFRLRTPTGGDDYAAMAEALRRRLQHALDKDDRFGALPDLLIVDGGRGQLNVTLSVLDEMGFSHIPAIGLAEQHELIYLPEEPEPLSLNRNSPELHLLQRIRDEAHRFAISYHRTLRSKNALYSVLDQIPGVGAKRKRALFDAFTTLGAIKAATVEELSAVSGVTRPVAQAVHDYFHPPENAPETQEND